MSGEQIVISGTSSEESAVCEGDGTRCVECGKVFTHPFYFSTHITTHVSQKGFVVAGQCTLCGLVFSNAAIYSAHMMSSQIRMEKQMVPQGNIVAAVESPAFVSKSQPTVVQNRPNIQSSVKENQNRIGGNPTPLTAVVHAENKGVISSIQKETVVKTQPSNSSMKQAPGISVTKPVIATLEVKQKPVTPSVKQVPVSSNMKPETVNSSKNQEPLNSNMKQEGVNSGKKQEPLNSNMKPEAVNSNIKQEAGNEEPRLKRKRKAPERFEVDYGPQVMPAVVETDPAVEAYLLSLKQMGLPVDPEAFGNPKGGKRNRRASDSGRSKGGNNFSWAGDSVEFCQDVSMPKKPSPKYEYFDDSDDSFENDLEVLPESGKLTRGQRLQQRQERLSLAKEEGGDGKTKRTNKLNMKKDVFDDESEQRSRSKGRRSGNKAHKIYTPATNLMSATAPKASEAGFSRGIVGKVENVTSAGHGNQGRAPPPVVQGGSNAVHSTMPQPNLINPNAVRFPSVGQFANRNSQHGALSPMQNPSSTYQTSRINIGNRTLGHQQGVSGKKVDNAMRFSGASNVQKSTNIEDLKKNARDNVEEMLQSVGMIAITSSAMIASQKEKFGEVGLQPVISNRGLTNRSGAGPSQRGFFQRGQSRYWPELVGDRDQLGSSVAWDDSNRSEPQLMNSGITGGFPYAQSSGHTRGADSFRGRGQNLQNNTRGSALLRGRGANVARRSRARTFRGSVELSRGRGNSVHKETRPGDVIVIEDDNQGVTTIDTDGSEKSLDNNKSTPGRINKGNVAILDIDIDEGVPNIEVIEDKTQELSSLKASLVTEDSLNSENIPGPSEKVLQGTENNIEAGIDSSKKCQKRKSSESFIDERESSQAISNTEPSSSKKYRESDNMNEDAISMQEESVEDIVGWKVSLVENSDSNEGSHSSPKTSKILPKEDGNPSEQGTSAEHVSPEKRPSEAPNGPEKGHPSASDSPEKGHPSVPDSPHQGHSSAHSGPLSADCHPEQDPSSAHDNPEKRPSIEDDSSDKGPSEEHDSPEEGPSLAHESSEQDSSSSVLDKVLKSLEQRDSYSLNACVDLLTVNPAKTPNDIENENVSATAETYPQNMLQDNSKGAIYSDLFQSDQQEKDIKVPETTVTHPMIESHVSGHFKNSNAGKDSLKASSLSKLSKEEARTKDCNSSLNEMRMGNLPLFSELKDKDGEGYPIDSYKDVQIDASSISSKAELGKCGIITSTEDKLEEGTQDSDRTAESKLGQVTSVSDTTTEKILQQVTSFGDITCESNLAENTSDSDIIAEYKLVKAVSDSDTNAESKLEQVTSVSDIIAESNLGKAVSDSDTTAEKILQQVTSMSNIASESRLEQASSPSTNCCSSSPLLLLTNPAEVLNTTNISFRESSENFPNSAAIKHQSCTKNKEFQSPLDSLPSDSDIKSFSTIAMIAANSETQSMKKASGMPDLENQVDIETGRTDLQDIINKTKEEAHALAKQPSDSLKEAAEITMNTEADTALSQASAPAAGNTMGNADSLLDIFTEIEKTCKEMEND